MPNYEDCIIYTIRSGDNLYVGSTCNFTKRKHAHKSDMYNKNRKGYTLKLYKTIRENGYEWDMKPYKLFPCQNKLEMIIEEERCRVELNADLNSQTCFGHDKQKYQHEYMKHYTQKNKDKLFDYHKTWQQNNRDYINSKVTCECGCISSKSNLPRHRKTKKHLELMENIKEKNI